MALFRFKVGAEVVIDSQVWRFVDPVRVDGDDAWFLKRLSDGQAKPFTVRALRALFDNRQMTRHYGEADGTAAEREAARKARVSIPEDLPAKDRARRDVRAEFLRRVTARIGGRGGHVAVATDESGNRRTLLGQALIDVSAELNAELGLPSTPEKPAVVSQASYYRWLKKAPDFLEDKRGLEGNFSARGRRNQLHPNVKRIVIESVRQQLAEMTDKRGVGKVATLSMNTMKKEIKTALNVEAVTNPVAAPHMALPSDATLYRLLAGFPAYDRAVAKFGVSRARREYRFVRGHDRPEGAYELVEYDETTMPFYFVDEERGVPLGRGSLCWGIDVASNAVGGLHVSFEPFSDMTLMSTLRHACSLKSYVATEYPDIKNDWLPGGIFRGIGADNSRQAWGKTLKEAKATLDCDLIWLPARTPWFKPSVEGMFGTLNTLVLRELAGFVLGRAIDAKDYDPAENACIGLRRFMHILHKWILDVYHVSPVGGPGSASPNQRWLEAAKLGEPGLLDSSDDLESLFGVMREGTLDHRGVVFLNIRYASDDLQALRLQNGRSMKVRIKINPSNLLHVMVRRSGGGGWVRATAIRPGYADGLSQHLHLLVQKHTRAKNRLENGDAYEVGLCELQAMIAENLPSALSLGTNALIARALGIGTQNLFGTMDGSGRLGPASGPFQGQRLNPAAATRRPDGAAGQETQALPGSSGSGLLPPQAIIPAAPIELLKPRRSIVRIEADDSLGRRSAGP